MDTKQPPGPDDKSKGTRQPAKRHPLIGSMKGMVQIAPGVDLTEPADPEWADRLDKMYPPIPRKGGD